MSFDELRKKVYWPSISNASWFFLASILFSLTILIASDTMLTLVNAKTDVERNNLDEIRQLYNGTLKEMELIKQYSSRYDSLYNKGFIGHEDRLSWVEIIKDVKQARNIPELSYTFKPVTGKPDYLGIRSDGLQIYSTENTIVFTLYDETDLDLLFNQLEKHARGIYTVESCNFERIADDLQLNRLGNIRGSCTLNWLSLRKIETPEYE